MKLLEMMMDPYPLRSALKGVMRGLVIGSYETRLRHSALPRPNYGYCVYNAAMLARKLGLSRISVLEYGVAGGAWLLNLEYHAEKVEKLLGVEIDIYGFDTAEGLPTPIDYRDLPYQWESEDFKMDVPKLQAKLKKAKLVAGPSSGPMHLAALCGTPHLVWTDKKTYGMRKTSREKYESWWNPLRTQVKVIDECGFEPPVNTIYQKSIRMLTK